jgi:hypothetical protein
MLDLRTQLKMELYNKIDRSQLSTPVYCELILENGLKVLGRRISPTYPIEVFTFPNTVDMDDYKSQKANLISPEFVNLFKVVA